MARRILFLSFCIIITTIGLAGHIQAKAYKGAELRTKEAFRYGRFEVRMKSHQMSGMLSSFFTYHEISSLDDWNEIDIEILGRYEDEVQFNTITPGQVNHEYEHVVPFNPHQGFHVYAIEWTPDYVAWQVNGAEVYRQTDPHIQTLNRPQQLMMNIWPPDYPDWVGSFNENELPAYAYYDWVRYYAYTPESSTGFTLSWEDDFDYWDQDRWGKGTHTWIGNNSDFVTTNAVFNDGYMILALTKADQTGYSGGAVVETDTDGPYITGAYYLDEKILVRFSEALDKTSAETISNYLIPGVTIQEALLLEDSATVVLTSADYDPLLAYNLVALNIQDQSSNAIATDFVTIRKPLTDPFSVNFGGDAEGDFLEDQEWVSDRLYGRISGTSVVQQPEIDIKNTDNDGVYNSEVRDLTSFRAIVSNGTYRITLFFAETEYQASESRVMDIYVQGQKRVTDLDIYKESGFETAHPVVLDNINVEDNFLRIYFSALKGETVLSGLTVGQTATALYENKHLPDDFTMNLYPNPFNPSNQIQLTLEKAARLALNVFDASGKRIDQIELGYKSAGIHSIPWDGSEFSSGVYFFVLSGNGNILATRKGVLLK